MLSLLLLLLLLVLTGREGKMLCLVKCFKSVMWHITDMDVLDCVDGLEGMEYSELYWECGWCCMAMETHMRLNQSRSAAKMEAYF